MTPDNRKPKRVRRRAGRGALFLLAILLAASGAMRLGLGIGEALARVPSDATPGADRGFGTAHAAEGGPLDCPAPPLAVAEALGLREARVMTQEAALADRTAALALTEAAVTARLTELERVEAELSETLARSDGAAEGDLAQLTKVYETMKPKDASALFAAMDAEFAAGFLGRMKPDSAAAILAGMQPEAAYAVSVLLAGRNALVPKE